MTFEQLLYYQDRTNTLNGREEEGRTTDYTDARYLMTDVYALGFWSLYQLLIYHPLQ